MKRFLIVAAVVVMAVFCTAALAQTEPDADDDNAAPVYGVTLKRTVAFSGVVVAIAGAVTGAIMLSRARRRVGKHGRLGAVVGIGASVVGLAFGAFVVATAEGGLGTGQGLAGGVVGIAIGSIGVALGALAAFRRVKRLT